MNIKLLLFSILGLFFFSISSFGQFYTIGPDTSSVELLSGYDASDYVYLSKDTQKIAELMVTKESDTDYFSTPKGREVEIEEDVPVFVNLQDSLLLALIHDRMNVCLPLDFLKINSRYGIRKDPISKCAKFHDGIDLRCDGDYVYSMLPGIVKKVRRGNSGYGNYIIIKHGSIECLYAHLKLIAVNEKDILSAGEIVGISGNTGRSTGPHLHIQLKKDGKSVNPNNFITYLNNYINTLQDKIAYLKFGKKPDLKLNIANLSKVMDKYNIQHKEIVIAQALLETGYFTSRVCFENNNLFGLRRKGQYYSFKNWEESVRAYRDYIQYKYKGGNYFNFLDKIGYAEDKNYTTKVRSIVLSLLRKQNDL